MKIFFKSLLLPFFIAFAAACSSETGESVDSLSFQLAAPETEPAVTGARIVWHVESPALDPDGSGYLFASSAASLEEDSVSVVLPAPPSEEEMNAGTIAVGYLILGDDEFMASGKVVDRKYSLELATTAATDQFAIVYINKQELRSYTDQVLADLEASGMADAAADYRERREKSRWWDMPDGYSCNRGVPAPEGETFDYFEPVPCSDIKFTIKGEQSFTEAFDFVNWT